MTVKPLAKIGVKYFTYEPNFINIFATLRLCVNIDFCCLVAAAGRAADKLDIWQPSQIGSA